MARSDEMQGCGEDYRPSGGSLFHQSQTGEWAVLWMLKGASKIRHGIHRQHFGGSQLNSCYIYVLLIIIAQH